MSKTIKAEVDLKMADGSRQVVIIGFQNPLESWSQEELVAACKRSVTPRSYGLNQVKKLYENHAGLLATFLFSLSRMAEFLADERGYDLDNEVQAKRAEAEAEVVLAKAKRNPTTRPVFSTRYEILNSGDVSVVEASEDEVIVKEMENGEDPAEETSAAASVKKNGKGGK